MPSTAPTFAGDEVAVDAARRRGDGGESIVAHGRARVAVREGSDAVVVVPFRGGVEACTHGEGSASWNTYADPLLSPVPTTTVPPSIETLSLNWSSAAPSSAVSLATCVQPEAKSLAVARVNT